MNKTRILIVEDEPEIQKFLRISLEAHAMECHIAPGATEAMKLFTRFMPELVLLDLGLAEGDGLSFIRHLRDFSQTPILVLSARGQEADKITALETGADDYLTKPFSMGELLARINVALRHARRMNETREPVFTQGALSVDLSARLVTLDGEALALTPLEYKLLTCLVRNAGKVVTYSQLLRDIWGKYAADNNTNLRIHMQHLRQKLGDDPIYPTYIQTEPGIGYRFKQSV